MAKGSIQPVMERVPVLSPGGVGGKGGQFVELTTLLPSYADCLEILAGSTSWRPKDISRPVVG